MSNPLVTAIITTHNRKDLLIEALESVLQQSYENIEIIIVDDASDDGTEDILQPYIIKKLVIYIYIDKEESRGCNYARNIGVNNSRGEYIAFLDDDDIWLPEKIEKEVYFLENNPDYGLVYCGFLIQKHGLIVEKTNFNYTPEGDCSEIILTRIIFLTSTLMIRRSLILEIGLFDEQLTFWQEYELGIRACQIAKVGLIKEYLIIYRANDQDKNRRTNQLEGFWNAVDYIKDKHSAKLNNHIREFNILALRDAANRADRCGRTDEKKKYLFEIYKIDPNLKNKIKYLLNTTTLKFWESKTIHMKE